jgi:osmotically-inducible protein OsmY
MQSSRNLGDGRAPALPLIAARGLVVAGLMAFGLTAFGLTGCAAVVVGGAAMGAAAVHDRRDYTAMLDDQEIELKAMSAISTDASLDGRVRIAITSYNRNVLLTGQADDDAAASRAAALVAALPKVDRVIDEVSVGPPISLAQESRDVFITSQAKIALAKVDLPGFDPTRVKVVTEDAVVYLMGLVSPEEGDASAERVRFVPGVKRVVKLFEYPQTQPPGPT